MIPISVASMTVRLKNEKVREMITCIVFVTTQRTQRLERAVYHGLLHSCFKTDIN